MKPARYHPAARDELRGAITYDEQERTGRGADLATAVRIVVERVRRLPQSAPRWLGLEAEIRRAKVKRHPYVVVYAVLPDQLVILALAHTRKKPGYWTERLAE